MIKEFRILLPNEKAKTYRIITFLILFINSLVFAIFLLKNTDNSAKELIKTGTVISILSLIFFLIKTYKKILHAFRPEISFIILSVIWIILGKYLLAIFMLLFAVFGFYASRKFFVIVTADQITYPSFPVKKYLWSVVNNAMIKDNVLTIDLKNNKLIQAVLEKESADRIDEGMFNDFCKAHLKVH